MNLQPLTQSTARPAEFLKNFFKQARQTRSLPLRVRFSPFHHESPKLHLLGHSCLASSSHNCPCWPLRLTQAVLDLSVPHQPRPAQPDYPTQRWAQLRHQAARQRFATSAKPIRQRRTRSPSYTERETYDGLLVRRSRQRNDGLEVRRTRRDDPYDGLLVRRNRQRNARRTRSPSYTERRSVRQIAARCRSPQ